MARKFFVGGNFKMNGTLHSLKELVKTLNDSKLDQNTEVVIAPPSIYLLALQEHVREDISVAAQNGYHEKNGAFTGEVSFSQLVDIAIPWVILGHSERRTLFHESPSLVGLKAKAALHLPVPSSTSIPLPHHSQPHPLSVILCIGESLEERENDKTVEVVQKQLAEVVEKLGKEEKDWKRIVIAYEPVWAIGTGKVATPQQAQEAHAAIRSYLSQSLSPKISEETRIIYGGSVSGKNCRELATQPDIDGFLVGGASLKPEFVDVINSKQQQGKI